MDIDSLVRAAHPPRLSDPSLVQTGLDDLLAGVVAGTRAVRPRRSRLRLGALAGLTALGLTAGGLAAAGTFTTHTGTCCREAGDRSEILDMGAPDFIPYLRSITQDIPFGPGYGPEPYWHVLTTPSPDGVGQEISSIGAKGIVAGWAACSWEWTWQGAAARGDASTAKQAVDALYRAADSRIMRQVNNATWTRRLADAAAAGDPRGFLANDVRVNCDGLRK